MSNIPFKVGDKLEFWKDRELKCVLHITGIGDDEDDDFFSYHYEHMPNDEYILGIDIIMDLMEDTESIKLIKAYDDLPEDLFNV